MQLRTTCIHRISHARREKKKVPLLYLKIESKRLRTARSSSSYSQNQQISSRCPKFQQDRRNRTAKLPTLFIAPTYLEATRTEIEGEGKLEKREGRRDEKNLPLPPSLLSSSPPHERRRARGRDALSSRRLTTPDESATRALVGYASSLFKQPHKSLLVFISMTVFVLN